MGRSAGPVLRRVWSPHPGTAGLRDRAEGVRSEPLPRAGGEGRGKDDATASDCVMGAHGVRQNRAGSRQRGVLLELTDHLVHRPTKFGVDGELKGSEGKGTHSEMNSNHCPAYVLQ